MSEPRNWAVQVRCFGAPDGLGVVDAPLPKVGPGEVRVRVLASSLEYTDTLIRRHLYPQTAARRAPFVLGYDVVGEIDQLGDGVSGFQIGDRVADMTVVGSNIAYRTLRASDLTRVPAGVDAAEAVALILSWTTAYQLLHRAARVQQGQRVLVHGAAGAVGQALIVLGCMTGLEVWGAARGGHATICDVFLTTLTGRCRLTVRTARRSAAMPLSSRSKGVVVPKGTWLRLDRFSPDAVVLVCASQAFGHEPPPATGRG